MLRLGCELEPDSAAVVGQTPAVAQCVDQEEAAAAFFGGTATDERVATDARPGIGHLAAKAVATGLYRQLDRAARTVSYGVGHELRDDQLRSPAIVVGDARALGRLAHGLACTCGRMFGRRQLERDRRHVRSVPGPPAPTR